MIRNKSPLEKEWKKLQRQEIDFLVKHVKKEDSKLNLMLADKVPEGLQDTLNKAFYKAFKLIFEKGTGAIEKTYDKEKIEIDYQAGEYVAGNYDNSNTLKAFSSKAKSSGVVNTLISGASGVGLGVLGIGIPDIVLFTAMVLKNVYQIALNFGYGYESEEEKKFILLLIQGALSSGVQLKSVNAEIDYFIDESTFTSNEDIEKRIKNASACMSKELLYMKFLQGIPVVGAIGGAYDGIYMRRISKYAELKYRRRFYFKKMAEK